MLPKAILPTSPCSVKENCTRRGPLKSLLRALAAIEQPRLLLYNFEESILKPPDSHR